MIKLSNLLSYSADKISSIYRYRVKAVGYGGGLSSYPIEFEMFSNFDIDDEDEHSREEVYSKARHEVERKGFRPHGYKIISLEKTLRSGGSQAYYDSFKSFVYTP